MIKHNVKSWSDHDFVSTIREIPPDTMTVPDQSLTVQQILDRFAVGLAPSGILQKPSWSEDPVADLNDDYIEPGQRQNFDLSDLNEIEKEIENGKAVYRRYQEQESQSST